MSSAVPFSSIRAFNIKGVHYEVNGRVETERCICFWFESKSARWRHNGTTLSENGHFGVLPDDWGIENILSTTFANPGEEPDAVIVTSISKNNDDHIIGLVFIREDDTSWKWSPFNGTFEEAEEIVKKYPGF